MANQFYREQFELGAHDVDANNNVRPSVIARLLQETANHHMRDRKPTYYELFFQGKSYILIRFSCQIKEQLHPYDRVEVDTWTSEGRGATFKRSYLMSLNGIEVARAYAEWAVVDLNTGRICRTDEIDSENYEKGEPIDMVIPSKFRFPGEDNWELCGSHIVGYSECDMNLHMNNTNYQDILWNHIPDVQSKKLTGFTIRFMAEAPLGGELIIYRQKSEVVIDDGCGGEESWYFKSLIGDKINVEAILNVAKTDRIVEWG